MPPVTGGLIAGRYIIRRALGAPGAQGEVYEVEDTYEADVVALKLMTSLPPGGAWVEAQILRQLADSHILPIRNADLHLGRPYLVTELATHGTLDDRLKAAGPKGLEVDDVVRWLRQACHGVGRAHASRLLHNDIKPGNLFVNGQAECLVGDFGFAALLPAGSNNVTPPGLTVETTAPEIASAWPNPIDAASVQSDVHSVGATGYMLLTGDTPYDFTGATDVPARMAVIAAGTPRRLRDLAPHVPRYVAAALERAIARNPADRYADVAALAASLGQRPSVTIRWHRTDEHAAHLACWRGERPAAAGPYVICLEVGSRASQRIITTTLANSGRRVEACCRTTTRSAWAQAVRSVIGALG
jgi:serine/threonine protein kinase